MAQLLVRKIDESLKEQLRARAKAKGRSLEEEARAILKQAVEPPDDQARYGLGSRIAALFADGGFTDDERAALELRGQPLRPATFD